MPKIIADSWMIYYNKPLFKDDDENYSASYEYKDTNGKHEVTGNFKSYAAAFGWLAERVKL